MNKRGVEEAGPVPMLEQLMWAVLFVAVVVAVLFILKRFGGL
jgi:hypothetical protein